MLTMAFMRSSAIHPYLNYYWRYCMKPFWIKKTNQGWKLVLLNISFYLIFVLIIFGLSGFEMMKNETNFFIVMMTALFLIFFYFVWLAIAFKCPHCGKSVGKHAFRSTKIGSWFDDFKNHQNCPDCHKSLIECNKANHE